jgi:superfamily II DNA helicase RecQ
MSEVGPADFARQAENLRAIMDNVRSGLAQELQQSAAFRVVMNIGIMPRISGTLALHSTETAFNAYGQSAEVAPMLTRQTAAFRDFVVGNLKDRHDTALAAIKAGPPEPPEQAGLSASIPRAPRSSSAAVSKSSARSKAAAKVPAVQQRLGNSSTDDDPPGQQAVASEPQLSTASSSPMKRARPNEETDPSVLVDNALQNRYGQRPYLSEQQKQLVHSTAKGRNVLAVMPTGSGKTLALIAYALAFPSSVSLLVLPLQALEQDMYDRLCQAVGSNRVVLFDAVKLPGYLAQGGAASTMRILIVSASDVVKKSAELGVLLARVEELQHPLTRLFVDEVQVFLESASFRQEFVNIGEWLQRFGRPIICTTATASPVFVAAIRTVIYGESKKHQPELEVIRMSSSRRNIAYQVVHCPPEEPSPVKAFAQVVKYVLQHELFGLPRQMLIFARTYDQCEAILKALKECLPEELRGLFDIYNGSEQHAAHREETFQKFKAGKLAGLIGTEAIGVGVDVSNIAAVLHYGTPTSIENFMQQSGRAARGSGTGLSLLFQVEKEYKALCAVLAEENSEAAQLAARLKILSPLLRAQAMYEYVQERHTCRVQYLAEKSLEASLPKSCLEMASAYQGRLVDLARCDICSVGQDGFRAAQLAAQNANDAIANSERLEDLLQQAELLLATGTICPFCTFRTSKPTNFMQSGCNHPKQYISFGRCVRCYGAEHYGSNCSAMDVYLPKRGSPSARCYKCLRLVTACGCTAGQSCTHVVVQSNTLFLARAALDALQKNQPAWDKLWSLMPTYTDLKRAATTPSPAHELLQELTRNLPERPGHCYAHAVLAYAVKTLKGQ